MKIRNTIKQLRRIRPLPELCTGDIQNALRTATRSLEAWDLVREEISEALFFDDKETVLKIIDKHLKGVED